MIPWKTIGALPGITVNQVPVWNGNQWAAGSGGAGVGGLALGNMGASPVAAAAEAITTVTGTFTANAALTVSGLSADDLMLLELTQNATGGFTLTTNGTSVPVNEAAGASTSILITYDGTIYYATSLNVAVQSVNGHTGQTVVLSASDVGAAAIGQVLANQADSGLAGIAFTGATPTFLTWTTPNDGNLHDIVITAIVEVTVAQTGGQVTFSATNPNGGPAITNQQIYPGGKTVGAQVISPNAFTVGPGAVCTVTQNTAQTAGAATFYGAIRGG